MIGSESASREAEKKRKYRAKLKEKDTTGDTTGDKLSDRYKILDIRDKRLDKDIRDKNNNIYADFEAEFETIWKAYPRKEGKTNALKAYIKARTDKEPVSFETVQEGVKRYIEYIKANNTEQRYIKHGSTWFNQRCWNDDYTAADNSNRPEGYEIIKQEPNDYDGITYHYANGIVRVFDDSKMMIKEYRE
jgi:hypothetical protein